MQSEVDEDLFGSTAKFCVYLHKRPDGSVFYIGKGLVRRAYDFSPSRRSAYHSNIVAKYGRENITVDVIPCSCEAEAFLLERAHISGARLLGWSIANLTEGGEGCSGRTVSERQAKALASGRGRGRKLSDEARRAMNDALVRGRETVARNGSLVEHRKRLGADGAKRLHMERVINCANCGDGRVTKSAKARFCGRRCEQQARRKRMTDAGATA